MVAPVNSGAGIAVCRYPADGSQATVEWNLTDKRKTAHEKTSEPCRTRHYGLCDLRR